MADTDDILEGYICFESPPRIRKPMTPDRTRFTRIAVRRRTIHGS
jgi:hypothetical protein